MKQQLLAIALSILFSIHLSGQDCNFPAANNCDSAKFICGFALNNYWGSNYGYQGGWFPPDLFSCGISPHNPQFSQIVPCSDHLSLTVTSFNCNTGDGLQVALADSCGGVLIGCDPGFQGGANVPLLLSANVVPGEPYILIIDGFSGDECDFNIQVLEGMDLNPPSAWGFSQPGKISFESLPCGPATLTVQLPVCQFNTSPTCQGSWADFYSDNCLSIHWNLPSGVEIISPDTNALTITVQFTQQVTNGMVSVNLVHTCPGINEDECDICIPDCCKAPIPPIFISSPTSSYTYVPCEEAPAYCAGSLDEVTFNNGCLFGGFGWWQATQWSWNNTPCFSLENPNLYRVIACEGSADLQIEVSNCEHHRGLEFNMMYGTGCDDLYSQGDCITVPENGQGSISLYYLPNVKFYLLVDGIDLDACDFTITEISNGGSNGQSNCLASQVIIDNFSPGWPYYSVSFDVAHPNETLVTGGAGTYYPSGYFVSNPIPCGAPYFFEIKTGGCIDTIAGSAPCYLPPDCENFNSPAPLADSCHLAPYFAGSCLDGFCGTTAGLTPDQPLTTTDTIPEFENNGWLRLAPCEDSIAIDFQVFDCQTGDELGFFLLSGDCDTMTLISFISAKDGDVAQLTASGLTPGEVYFLAVDGFYNAECKFQAHVLEGFGIEPDTAICSNCTPSVIDGPSDLCPGDFATYTFTPGGCDVTFIGGNGQLCSPPDICQLFDTVELHWTIPPFMNFVGDSVGVYSITVQVDTNLIGIDTVLTGQVNAFWAPAPGSGGGGGNGGDDDNVFCGCTSLIGNCVSPIIPKDVTVHHDVETDYCELTCVQPCCSYNGQSYCSPGTYIVSQTNCLTQKLIVFDNTIPPPANAGPNRQICIGESANIGGQPTNSFLYVWSSGATTSQQTVSPVVTTTYMLTVTDPNNGCTATDNVTVSVVPNLQINLPPKTICEGECIYVAGEEFCSAGNFVVVAQSYLGCDSVISFSIIVKPYVVTNHGMVGTLTCDVTSISFMGNTYDQPGPYVVPEPNGCGEHQFVIDLDNSPPFVEAGQPQEICAGQTATLAVSPILPSVEYWWSNGVSGSQIEVSLTTTTTYTVIAQNYDNGCASADQVTVTVNLPTDTDLGVVGILTCDQLEINVLGNNYDQPGQYSVPKPNGCGNNTFTILTDVAPPWCPVLPISPICADESVTLQTAPPFPSNLTYLWNTGETTQEITVTPLVTSNYTVTATNPANGCSSIVTTTVEVNQPQVVQLGQVGVLTCSQPCFTFNGQTYCQPGTYSFTENCEIKEFQIGEDLTLPTVQLGQVGVLTCSQPCFTFNGQIYCQPGTYSITENCEIKEFQIGEDLTLPTVQLGQVGVLTCSQPCFTFNGQTYCQPGTYSFTENCEIKEFQIGDLLPVWLELGEDQTITAGESAELQAQTNAQPAVITWHNSTGAMSETQLGITVQPTENTLYSLKIQDVNGCLLEDSVWVLVKKADGSWFAPNVVKPSATGLNAWFTLYASPDYVAEIQLLEIFDRWGNLVFTQKNFPPNAPESGWDGTDNGKMLDPAVFVWHAVLLLNDGTTEKAKGDVTVLR